MHKLGFMFPGQGSQYYGMSTRVYEASYLVRDLFQRASEILNIDVMDLCSNPKTNKLFETQYAQSAILTTSVANYIFLVEQFKRVPEYFAGHSLGEYSALVCAGMIDFEDAVKLVWRRGKLMQEISENRCGIMVALFGVSLQNIEKLCEMYTSCDSIVVVSNINSPKQIVISGHQSAVEKVVEKVLSLGGKAHKLENNAAFHSPIMQPVAEKLQKDIAITSIRSGKGCVISSITGRPYKDEQEVKELLIKQITTVVRWTDTINYICNQGGDVLIDMGPKAILKDINEQIDKLMVVISVENKMDIDKLYFEILQDEKYSFLKYCLTTIVCSKNILDDLVIYNSKVVHPYLKIKNLLSELNAENKWPSEEQELEAAIILEAVLMHKGVPVNEQLVRYKKLLDFTCGKHEKVIMYLKNKIYDLEENV